MAKINGCSRRSHPFSAESVIFSPRKREELFRIPGVISSYSLLTPTLVVNIFMVEQVKASGPLSRRGGNLVIPVARGNLLIFGYLDERKLQ